MNNRKPLIFFSVWLVISLAQAYCTNLSSDEGYYWFYTQHLQWGYYDHPPMVALLIKMGYSLFQNELGVRLMNVLVTSCNFLLLFRLIPENLKQKNFIYLILAAQPLLNYFSIIVFPDGPLLFFSLVFLLGYKQLITKNDWVSACWIGLSLTGMMYSKYHGVLLLLFTVLSNFSILRSKWFWISLLIPLTLSLPHLWWQYNNNFPSLQYHLLDRATGFRWTLVGQYISQQAPAIGPLFLIAAFGFKSENQFEKTLKYISVGTIFFFLFASCRGFVHFHWTSLALFPLSLMAMKYYTDRKKLLYWLTIPFLLIIIIYRIHIVFPFLPFKQNDLGYYKNRDKWAEDISQLAKNRPVVFSEDFREAGLYSFYSGKMAIAIFSNISRKTQFDLWGYEDSVQGREVLVVRKRAFDGSSQFESRLNKTINYLPVKNFESYYNIPFEIKLTNKNDDSLQVSIKILNNRKTDLNFYIDPVLMQPVLFYQLRKNNKEVLTDTLRIFTAQDKLVPGSSGVYEFSISIKDLTAGHYNFLAGFNYGSLPPSYNSMKNEFMINSR